MSQCIEIVSGGPIGTRVSAGSGRHGCGSGSCEAASPKDVE